MFIHAGNDSDIGSNSTTEGYGQGSRSYANDIDFWLLCSHLNFATLFFVEMC